MCYVAEIQPRATGHNMQRLTASGRNQRTGTGFVPSQEIAFKCLYAWTTSSRAWAYSFVPLRGQETPEGVPRASALEVVCPGT